MIIEVHHLNHGGSLDLSQKSAANGNESHLYLIVGSGRGCTLRAGDQLAGIWLPMRGRLQLGTASADITAQTGEMLVSESDVRVHAIGRGNAVWIALLGTTAVWQRTLGSLSDIPASAGALIPARYTADRDLRWRALALARSCLDDGPAASIESLVERVAALQDSFAPAISRCPGRTYSQRRQVFLRLQRVRNYLAANCHLDIDNDALAKMASYSPWHFIRAFRAAYQETPHVFLVRARLDRAQRLLGASELAIAEVAVASGFENRCAFSRLFRQRFGISAGAMRRRNALSAVETPNECAIPATRSTV